MDELMERRRLIAALLIRIDIKINIHRWTMKNNKRVKKKKNTPLNTSCNSYSIFFFQ